MKKYSTAFRARRAQLNYWQSRVRMDIASLRRTIQRAKQEGHLLRELQRMEADEQKNRKNSL